MLSSRSTATWASRWAERQDGLGSSQMEAAREPEDHEHQHDEPGGRPTGIPVARMAPTAACESQNQKNDENQKHEFLQTVEAEEPLDVRSSKQLACRYE